MILLKKKIKIDKNIWKATKKAAIDLDVSASDFVESALLDYLRKWNYSR